MTWPGIEVKLIFNVGESQRVSEVHSARLPWAKSRGTGAAGRESLSLRLGLGRGMVLFAKAKALAFYCPQGGDPG